MNSEPLYKEANTELIEQCKKGNNEAFKELYYLYNKAMFNISLRILNNNEEAQDVLQDSFISAFKNIKQYNNIASFGSWLKRIVINRSIDAIKKKKLDFIPLTENDIAEEVAVDESVAYDVDSIKRAVAELPDGYRLILTLFLFENYSHRMIAEQLNISEGTSKSQYSRARKKLLELIKLKVNRHE